jgi:hypothetical protein
MGADGDNARLRPVSIVQEIPVWSKSEFDGKNKQQPVMEDDESLNSTTVA